MREKIGGGCCYVYFFCVLLFHFFLYLARTFFFFFFFPKWFANNSMGGYPTIPLCSSSIGTVVIACMFTMMPVRHFSMMS